MYELNRAESVASEAAVLVGVSAAGSAVATGRRWRSWRGWPPRPASAWSAN